MENNKTGDKSIFKKVLEAVTGTKTDQPEQITPEEYAKNQAEWLTIDNDALFDIQTIRWN